MVPSAADVVTEDLRGIAKRLDIEFASMAGKRLLITGGAGFLGYYLVQAPLEWNRSGAGDPIDVVVYDNWIRGVPSWLQELESDPHLTLVTHDITGPMPQDAPDFDYIIHAASIASPIYYRLHPIETMDANVGGLRNLLDYALQRKAANRRLRTSPRPRRTAATSRAPARAPATTSRSASARRSA
jgi:dTDP-glucose 4,6-dehydratase/UDP-glucuronate decarboxylase